MLRLSNILLTAFSISPLTFRFVGSCKSLLVQVFDGLMLPLPLALSPPSSPITPHSNTSDSENEEEDQWSNHRSLGSKPSTLDTKPAQSRVYVQYYECGWLRAFYSFQFNTVQQFSWTPDSTPDCGEEEQEKFI